MGTFSNNAITNSGRSLLADVMAGAIFTPTRIVMGSGTLPNGVTPQNITAVVTEVKSLAINKKERTPDGKLIVGGVYSNTDITTDFYFRELALYAKAVYLNANGTVKSEGAEILYSYGNAGTSADLMPAFSTTTVVEKQLDLVTWVGNTAQVDLSIESGIYASAEDLEALRVEFRTAFQQGLNEHTSNKNNPHGVTAAQVGARPNTWMPTAAEVGARPNTWTPTAADVGLGNVPNVSTNNQKPTFTVASALADLISGEALSTSMGKIAKAVATLSSHLANKNNPHGVTAAQVGARPNTWLPTPAEIGAANVETGSYIGTGTYGSSYPASITFTKGTPVLVIIQRDNAGSSSTGIIIPQSGSGLTATNSAFQSFFSSLSGRKLTWYNNNSNVYQLNESGFTYRYTAFVV